MELSCLRKLEANLSAYWYELGCPSPGGYACPFGRDWSEAVQVCKRIANACRDRARNDTSRADTLPVKMRPLRHVAAEGGTRWK
jgi:hypothetical protein